MSGSAVRARASRRDGKNRGPTISLPTIYMGGVGGKYSCNVVFYLPSNEQRLCEARTMPRGFHGVHSTSEASFERPEMCTLRYRLGARYGEFIFQKLGQENKTAPTGSLGSDVPYTVRDEAMCVQIHPATKRTLVEFRNETCNILRCLSENRGASFIPLNLPCRQKQLDLLLPFVDYFLLLGFRP